MSEARKNAQFKVGDWTVAPSLGQIFRNSNSIILEPRLMDLLVFLAEHSGETVSTEDLAQSVWAGRAVSDQPVYQGIAQLRKALNDDARHPQYIATVTKKGYRLIAKVSLIDSDTSSSQSAPRPTSSPKFLAPAFSLILAGTYLFFSSSDVSVSREQLNPALSQFASIAVLPFVDMSEDGGQQFLGDGIAEELIHRIASVPDVRVVARTSSFSFRKGEVDVRTIGERLGADAILEGSVRRSGDRLRITAQLVNAYDGYHIWSETYESVFSDALAIQDDIARAVARLMRSGLGNQEILARSWTRNSEAAEAYYLGMFHLRRSRVDSLARAIEYLRRAVELDPQFVLAYVALAETYLESSEHRFGNMPSEEAQQNWYEMLRIAESLDNELAEVLLMLAREAVWNGSSAEAESLYLRAIDANPNYSEAYMHYGGFLARTGRNEESLAVRLKAVELDPLDVSVRFTLASTYYLLNRIADTEAELRTAIELDPTFHAPYAFLSDLLYGSGRLAQALEIAEKAATVESPDARWAGAAALGVGYTYMELGDYAAAEKWYERGREMGETGWYQANQELHLLLAQDRFDDADALLTYWEENAPPNLPNVFSLGGLYRAMMGQDDRAIASFERALAMPREGDDGDVPNLFRSDFLNWGYVPAVHFARLKYRAGDTEEGDRWLADSEQFIASRGKEAAEWPGTHYVRASIHALRDNGPEALASLERAIDGFWLRLWFVERDPIFARFRGDPEFEAQVARIRAHLTAQREELTQLEQKGNSL